MESPASYDLKRRMGRNPLAMAFLDGVEAAIDAQVMGDLASPTPRWKRKPSTSRRAQAKAARKQRLRTRGGA